MSHPRTRYARIAASVSVAASGTFAVERLARERREDRHRARPVIWNWKARERPAEVPVIAAARRLGDGREPRGGDGRVQERGERVRIVERRRARDVAAVDRHGGVARGEHQRARRLSDVAPHDARQMAPRRVGPEERPPSRARAARRRATRGCRRQGASHPAAPAGSCRIGASRCRASRARPIVGRRRCHARTASPRSSGRSMRRSTRPSRPPPVTGQRSSRASRQPACGVTMNASLHPLFTPRIGRAERRARKRTCPPRRDGRMPRAHPAEGAATARPANRRARAGRAPSATRARSSR